MINMDEIVEAEIKEYKKKYGEDWQAYYFNNFGFNLPDDDCEHGGYYRETFAKSGWLDMTIAKRDPANKLGYSYLYRNQTARDFFKTVDQTLEEQGISLKEIKRLQHLKNREGSEHWKKLSELVLPAYIKLRELGYQRYPDLVK